MVTQVTSLARANTLRRLDFLTLLFLGLFVTLATGCGGGGDDSHAAGAQTTDIEGVWQGSRSDAVYLCIVIACTRDHYQTVPAIALASRDGRLHLITPGFDSVFVGRVDVSGGRVSGTLRHNCDPLGGPPTFGHVSIDGSFAYPRSLDLSYDLDECLGDGVFNLAFDPESRHPASLSTIEGVWWSSQTVVNIAQDGEILGSTDRGCQLSGYLVPASETVNLFDANIMVENCRALVGQYSGLATVLGDDAASSKLIISMMRSNGTLLIELTR